MSDKKSVAQAHFQAMFLAVLYGLGVALHFIFYSTSAEYREYLRRMMGE